MTNERANELFREYRKTGDKAIRNELIENYMYVAQILAKKFAGRGVDYDDLLQIASEALISGVEKFDPDLGYMFTTYVTPTITGIIRNYFRDYSRSVRVPRKLYALSAKVKAAVNEFYKANGVKPTVKQLSEQLGESEETILEAMECRAPVSLDSTVKGEDSDVPLYEVIADGHNFFENFEDNESLKTEIAKLS
ncbi:MAG: sigma-70 family RNA polymerase sigma factor, partial [Clostridia bacterium]|nr:sigma-70 family RNA polymerase sigma factor [Clostridia bacterium]